MEHKIIKIVPIIYPVVVTSHSNNKQLKCFCLPCLSRVKVNKVYKDFETYSMISNNRVCSVCGAMTTTAAVCVFNISIANLIKMCERRVFFEAFDPVVECEFHIEQIYLNILKGTMNHGKVK